MKTAEQILKEKYMDDRNLKEDGPTLIPHVMLEAMEEYAQQRVEEYQKEFHNKLMVKFEQDFGSIHNSISMYSRVMFIALATADAFSCRTG